MKKRLISLAALLFLVSCSESEYTSPLSSTPVKEELSVNTRATSSAWTKGVVGYPFYSPTSVATSYFTGTGVPISGTSITNVSWSWNDFPNGEVDYAIIQYTRPYSSYVVKSEIITNRNQGFTSAFNGESARGQISIKFKSKNGIYPLRRTLADTVTVNYTK